MLDALKSLLRDTLGLPAPLILLLVGLCVHLVANALLRRTPTGTAGLLAVALLAVLIESVEIWQHYRVGGLFAAGNDPLWQILARHSLDVATMLALPVLLVVGSRLVAAVP